MDLTKLDETFGPVIETPTIDKALHHLYGRDPFYVFFVQAMRRVYDETLPAPAGVSNYRGLEIRVNPRIWERLTMAQQALVLEHECKHLLFDHLNRVTSYPEYKSLMRFYNICMDLAVNSTIPNAAQILPMGIHVETFQAQGWANLKPAQTFDYYVGYFQEEQEKLIQACKNAVSDDHDGWQQEGDGEPQAIKEAAVKEAVNRAVQNTERIKGNISGSLRELIGAALKNTNNWRRLIQQFPAEATTFDSESCRMRRNRRYGTAVPGQRKTYRTKIGVGVDTSGSIGPAELGAFVSEINKIIGAGAEVTVYFFDTRVAQRLPVRDRLTLTDYDNSGGGGTSFQPVLDAAKEDNMDGLVMLTDGYNFDTITKPAYPVLWAIVANPGYAAPFGKVVHVEVDGNG